MMKGKIKTGASALRGAAISALVILFFLGVIIAYYVMLTSETRQRLIKSSELVAVTAAQEAVIKTCSASAPRDIVTFDYSQFS